MLRLIIWPALCSSMCHYHLEWKKNRFTFLYDDDYLIKISPSFFPSLHFSSPSVTLIFTPLINIFSPRRFSPPLTTGLLIKIRTERVNEGRSVFRREDGIKMRSFVKSSVQSYLTRGPLPSTPTFPISRKKKCKSRKI